jgi:hypothetical protein
MMQKHERRELNLLTTIWVVGLFAYMLNDLALRVFHRGLPLRCVLLLTSLACAASFSLILNFDRLNAWSSIRKMATWAVVLIIIVFPATWSILVTSVHAPLAVVVLMMLFIGKICVLDWLRSRAIWLLKHNTVSLNK